MGGNTSFEIMHWSKDHESFIFKFLTFPFWNYAPKFAEK